MGLHNFQRHASAIDLLSAAPYVQQYYALAAPQTISLVGVAKPDPTPLVKGTFSTSPGFANLSLAKKRDVSSDIWNSGHSSELHPYNPSIARVPEDLRSKLNGAVYAIVQRVTNHHRCYTSKGIPGTVVNLFAFGLLDASLDRMVGHEALVALPAGYDGFSDCRLQTVTTQARRPEFMLTCNAPVSIWHIELRVTEESRDVQFRCQLPLRCPTGQNRSNLLWPHVVQHGLAVALHGHRLTWTGELRKLKMAKNLNLLEAEGRLFVEVWILNGKPRRRQRSESRLGRRLHEVRPLDNNFSLASAALLTYEDSSITKPIRRLYSWGQSWSASRGGGAAPHLLPAAVACLLASATPRTLPRLRMHISSTLWILNCRCRLWRSAALSVGPLFPFGCFTRTQPVRLPVNMCK